LRPLQLPQSARKQLSWDAERLQAAVALWAHVNARIGASGHSIIADAILTFMDEVGEGFGEDPLRLFFRTKVGAVGNVLEEVAKQAKGVVDSSVGAEDKSEKLFEANQVILVRRARSLSLSLAILDNLISVLELTLPLSTGCVQGRRPSPGRHGAPLRPHLVGRAGRAVVVAPGPPRGPAVAL